VKFAGWSDDYPANCNMYVIYIRKGEMCISEPLVIVYLIIFYVS